MGVQQIACRECDRTNEITYHSATRQDPGYWGRDLECEECGADLEAEDAEPYTREDYEAERADQMDW